MTPPAVACPHCGYEITRFTEVLESLEGGGCCLLCGGEVGTEALRVAVDSWDDDELVREGQERAADEAEVTAEEELFDGVPDFGDESEDEDDPLL